MTTQEAFTPTVEGESGEWLVALCIIAVLLLIALNALREHGKEMGI